MSFSSMTAIAVPAIQIRVQSVTVDASVAGVIVTPPRKPKFLSRQG